MIDGDVAVIVVDASVLANALADDDRDGDVARAAIDGQDLSAPDLADVEVASVLRRRWHTKTLSAGRYADALDDLADLPLQRYPVLSFLRRGYELRDNVTAYDATYVALAEQLNCPLVTADARLAHAPGLECTVTVVS